jgi:plastocyanin
MVFRARAAVPLALLALSAVALTGCGWVAAGDTSSHGKDTVATASPGTGGMQTITVTAGERMRFAPSVISAHAGKLAITLKVTGPTPHDLEIPSLHASTGQVDQGKSGTIEVTLAKAGRVDFVCTYHEKHGMTGYITVS